MKIAVINGSPKIKNSASENISRFIIQRLGTEPDIGVCSAMSMRRDEIIGMIDGSKAIVFVFPLYVDGIPSHLLRFLVDSQAQIAEAAPGSTLYSIINCGFYEARQTSLAIDMMKSFCQQSGLRWGEALGIGGGGMLSSMRIGRGPTRKIGQALDLLAKNILELKTAENSLVEPGIPRFIYILAAHLGWKMQAKKNGLKVKQLYERR
jgi:multimeric flavodoxin WrbA